MASIQQFDQLPENIQKEILDFMDFVVEKNGIILTESDEGKSKSRWLKTVKRHKNSGISVSHTVRQLRDEEKW